MTSIILSAISFLADIIALGKVAYNIIIKNQTSDIVLQIIAIVLVFLLGVGLGSFGLRGFKRDSIDKVLRFYVWAYLILACLSYLGVVVSFRDPFSLSSYFAYFVIIGIQLLAFSILRAASLVRPVVSHALALMTISVIHALIFLYEFIFVEIPELEYVIGEWIFWLAWTLIAVPLLRMAIKGTRPQSKLR